MSPSEFGSRHLLMSAQHLNWLIQLSLLLLFFLQPRSYVRLSKTQALVIPWDLKPMGLVQQSRQRELRLKVIGRLTLKGGWTVQVSRSEERTRGPSWMKGRNVAEVA